MFSKKIAYGVTGAVLALGAAATQAQTAQHRPPAVPLVVNDPFLSIWSMADKLTDAPTKHWSEAPQPLVGLIRIDGHAYRWMGLLPRGFFPADSVPALPQTALEVTPLHSRYTFAGAGVQLHITFFTPLLPSDLDVLSRPVSYLSWSVTSTDGKEHDVQLMLDVDPQVAVNDPSQQVVWNRSNVDGLTVLSVGSKDQPVLQRAGDRVREDWGYFHVAVPNSESPATSLSFEAAEQFVKDGSVPRQDDLTMPKPADFHQHPAHLGTVLPLGKVGETAVNGHLLLAYTDGFSIEYLGRKLRGYWQRNGMTEADLLSTAEREYPALEAKGVAFDNELQKDMATVGGEDYRWLTALAFRQTVAAHKLVADADGTPMLFSKENDSNGCIDTVDVTYPSSPFFLLFNPHLLEAQLEPMMRYASLPRWRFPFAPHDLGTYPLADGQVYGGGEKTEENQMPVEESGDLLLMIAAMSKAEGNYNFAKRFMPELTKWAAYLQAKGLDPENQLSTDDFSGHLAHNTNLSIKAIEALGAFAQIAHGVGDDALAKTYQSAAAKLPAKWQEMAREGDHYKLAFDQPNTWSQKYNLVWDDLLGLHLFPAEIARTEWAFYEKQMQPNGLPLDNRKTITKLDWEIWTATMTHDPNQLSALMTRTTHWIDTSPTRVPLTDYFDTVSGKQMGFQARSVVGSVFIKALADPAIAKKWESR